MMQNAFISRPKGPAYAMGYSYREIPWTIVFLVRVKNMGLNKSLKMGWGGQKI